MIVSGKWGRVNGEPRIRNFNISKTGNSKAYVASNTAGGSARKLGMLDWSGTFNEYGYEPAAVAGDLFTFEGYTAPNDEATEGGTGVIYTGPAIIDQTTIAWNWEGAELLTVQNNFSGAGELTEDEDTMAVDEATPGVDSVEGSITYQPAGSGAFEEFCAQSAQLVLSAANKSYANSCTNGWMARKSGPLDATLAITVQNQSIEDLPWAIGDDVEFKLYATASLFWWLKWMHFMDVSNIQVDRETGNIISMVLNFGLNIRTATGLGKVVKPSSELWLGTA